LTIVTLLATRASSFSYAQGLGLRKFNAIINALLFIRQQTSVINAIRAHLADFDVIAPPAPDLLSGFRRHGSRHPIGATGAILTTKLIHSMRRDGLKRGLITLCIGGGQGIALGIETAHQIVIRSS
jgi:hypothetical protein